MYVHLSFSQLRCCLPSEESSPHEAFVFKGAAISGSGAAIPNAFAAAADSGILNTDAPMVVVHQKPTKHTNWETGHA